MFWLWSAVFYQRVKVLSVSVWIKCANLLVALEEKSGITKVKTTYFFIPLLTILSKGLFHSYHCNSMCGSLLFSFSQPLLSLFLTFPSIFLSALFSPHSPHFTSALVLLFSFPVFFSSPPCLASAWLHPYSTSPPDKWGHCLAASSGASRARLLRAQSVKRHQSPVCGFSFLGLFLPSSCSSPDRHCTRPSECQLQIWWLTSLFAHLL